MQLTHAKRLDYSKEKWIIIRRKHCRAKKEESIKNNRHCDARGSGNNQNKVKITTTSCEVAS